MLRIVSHLARATLTVALCHAVLLAPSAQATVVVPLDYGALTRQADVVVQGSVIAQTSFWGPSKERIYTHTKVAVTRTLKGRAPSVLTVRQWGGQVDDVRMDVPGNADLKYGEEVVLFLSTDGQYHFVVALAQGKFSLAADASGRKLAHRALDGLTFARWNAQGRMSLSPRWELAAPISLDALEAEVKRALSTPPSSAPAR